MSIWPTDSNAPDGTNWTISRPKAHKGHIVHRTGTFLVQPTTLLKPHRVVHSQEWMGEHSNASQRGSALLHVGLEDKTGILACHFQPLTQFPCQFRIPSSNQLVSWRSERVGASSVWVLVTLFGVRLGSLVRVGEVGEEVAKVRRQLGSCAVSSLILKADSHHSIHIHILHCLWDRLECVG
jgi:hypothetical protein